MDITELLKSSLVTLKANGRRTFLTMIGIIIGISSVITIISLGNGYQKQMVDSLAKDEKGRVSQQFYYSPNGEVDFERVVAFKDSDIEAIMAIPGVDEAKIDLMGDSKQINLAIETDPTKNEDTFEGGAISFNDFTNMSASPGSLELKFATTTNEDMLFGRNLNSADSKGLRRNIIIDEEAAILNFESAEKAINKGVTLNEKGFQIVGVYAKKASVLPASNNMLTGQVVSPHQGYIPEATYQSLFQQNSVNFSMTAYFLPDVDIKAVSKQINDYLAESGSGKDQGTYSYFDTSEMMKGIGDSLSMITYFISAIAAISLFIAGVGVMNMMYISVSERTQEIGIRRSLGATKQSIQWQFLLEGVVITTAGGLIGYISGVWLAAGIGRFLPFKPVTDIQSAIGAVLVSVLIGIVFSVFPAKAAAKKNVVEILR